jgi:hypothetical protein
MRQVLSGLAVYTTLVLTIDFGIFIVVPLLSSPVGMRGFLSSLFALIGFVVLAGLLYFLFRKLCRGAWLAWWIAGGCNVLLLLYTGHAFWFAHHYRNDWERTDRSFSFLAAIFLGVVTMNCFGVLSLPGTRKYCGVSRS